MNKNILQKISNQEMDRKDFLKYSGIALLGVVGLKTVATLLFRQSDQKLVAVVCIPRFVQASTPYSLGITVWGRATVCYRR